MLSGVQGRGFSIPHFSEVSGGVGRWAPPVAFRATGVPERAPSAVVELDPIAGACRSLVLDSRGNVQQQLPN